jgi:hypothetical protein
MSSGKVEAIVVSGAAAGELAPVKAWSEGPIKAGMRASI